MIFIKIFNFIRSWFVLIKYKILYGKSFNFKSTTRVGKNFNVTISNGGTVSLGNRVRLRDNVIIRITGGNVLVKDDVFLNDMVCINARNRITIEENVIIGQGVYFYDHDHDYRSSSVQDNYVLGVIKIGKNSWIGSQCVILRNSIVGNDCVIGAQTLVNNSFDNNSLVYDKRQLVQKGYK